VTSRRSQSRSENLRRNDKKDRRKADKSRVKGCKPRNRSRKRRDKTLVRRMPLRSLDRRPAPRRVPGVGEAIAKTGPTRLGFRVGAEFGLSPHVDRHTPHRLVLLPPSRRSDIVARGRAFRDQRNVVALPLSAATGRLLDPRRDYCCPFAKSLQSLRARDNAFIPRTVVRWGNRRGGPTSAPAFNRRPRSIGDPGDAELSVGEKFAPRNPPLARERVAATGSVPVDRSRAVARYHSPDANHPIRSSGR